MSFLNKGAVILAALLVISGCSVVKLPYYPSNDFKGKSSPNTSAKTQAATMRPYVINGKKYYPTVVEIGDTASGIASWYGPDFHGKSTSNGERYDMNTMTAAHKTLPMNTMVRVTNLRNSKTAIVRINDRGPFVSGRIIDLSKAAANSIAMIGTGTAPVRLEVVGFYGKTSVASNAIKVVEGGNFMVQIGAFKKLSGAQSYKAEYNGAGGYKTEIKKFTLDEEPIYRVFLVGYRSEEEARDFIAAKKYKGAFIVRDN